MADPELEKLYQALGSLSSGNVSTGGGGYGVPLNATSPIYMGTKPYESKAGPGPYAPGYKPNRFVGDPGSLFLSGGEKNISYGEARLMPRDWTPDEMKQFVNKGILYKVKGFDTDMGMPEILAAWDDLVQASYALNEGKKDGKWTPWDVLESYSDSDKKFGTQRQGDWIIDLNTGQRVKYVGKTKKTTVDKRVDLSSSEDVKALTHQILREALGRIPTEEELAQFRTTINSMEQATPEVVTTTTEFAPVAGGEAGMELQEVGSTSTRTGGLSAEARQLAIQESVRETPEYQKYQSGTTYFNALMQMIAGG